MSIKSLTAGIALALVGLTLLLRVAGVLSFSILSLWPLLPICWGVVYEHSGWNYDARGGSLLTGGVLIIYGVMFLACELTSWSLMAYIWPGFLLGPALGLRQQYLRDPSNSGARVASLVLGSVGGLLLLGTFVSMQLLIPGLMIVAGIALLVSVLRRVR